MDTKNGKYNVPIGYSLIQTMLFSRNFVDDPIKGILNSMNKFSETYSASLGRNRKLILTKNPAFINYVLKENHKNYIKSEMFYEGTRKFVGHGLIFSNGDYWLRQRRLIQPAFHRQKIQGLYDIAIRVIHNFLSTFPTGENIDIHPHIHRLSFNVIIKSLFDIEIPPQIMEELLGIFEVGQEFLIKRRLFYQLKSTENINLERAKRVRGIFAEIISQRRSSNKSYADLLDMLLNIKYEDTGESMSEEQIIDEAMVLIFAGHETTGNAISWLLYLIASDNTVLQKLIASIENITIYESLSNEYIQAAIYETMRLYPPVWIVERLAIEDDSFQEFSFPANTMILSFFYGLHRDKNLWEEESKFKPERFMGDSKEARSKNYFPFAAGPRMCIGNNFAMMEMTFFLYSFLKEFQIESTGYIPEMKALITLRPDKVLLNIKRINH